MTTLREEYFGGSNISLDFFSAFVGDELGRGIARTVFTYELNPNDYVLKIERHGKSFQNVAEWEIWDRIKETRLAPWFAPCKHISPSGIVLLQQRTTPIHRIEDMPKRIPSFFTDTKIQNWGRLGNRIVCHDYGRNLLLEQGMTSKMKKAEWWGLT